MKDQNRAIFYVQSVEANGKGLSVNGYFLLNQINISTANYTSIEIDAYAINPDQCPKQGTYDNQYAWVKWMRPHLAVKKSTLTEKAGQSKPGLEAS